MTRTIKNHKHIKGLVVEKFVIVLILLFFSCTHFLPGESDTELWTSVQLKFNLKQGFRLYLEGQYRFDNDITAEKCKFAEIGVGYKIKKWINIRANYRLSDYPYETRNRFDINMTLSLKNKKFKLSNRFRLQDEIISGIDPLIFFRNKVKLELKVTKRVIPFIGAELLLSLKKIGRIEDRMRLTSGVRIKALKKLSLDLYYHYQQTLRSYNKDIDNIFVTKLSYSF